MGQCVMEQSDDRIEVYPSFAFISRSFPGTTLRKLVESMTGESGIEVAPGFPFLRLTTPHPNWREEIVQGHATASGMPARRFRVTIQSNPPFANDQLIDYELPYRPSAERYVTEFLRLNPGRRCGPGRASICWRLVNSFLSSVRSRRISSFTEAGTPDRIQAL
jgi:hypothetical protein